MGIWNIGKCAVLGEVANTYIVRILKEQTEARKKRYDDEQLAKCTFTPNTEWHLAAERRKKQREAAERKAYEARRSPKRTPLLSVNILKPSIGETITSSVSNLSVPYCVAGP